MEYLFHALTTLCIFCLAAFIGSTLALFVRRARPIAKRVAAVALIGFFVTGFASVPISDRAAREAGFADLKSQQEAERSTPHRSPRRRPERGQPTTRLTRRGTKRRRPRKRRGRNAPLRRVWWQQRSSAASMIPIRFNGTVYYRTRMGR